MNSNPSIEHSRGASGMHMYMASAEIIALNESKEDPITFDTLNILKPSPHPRGSLSIRRDNDKPYFYNVGTIIQIIEQGDGKDPFTRQRFDDITQERAYLYYSLVQNFPDLTKEEMDCKQVYTEWMADHNHAMKLLKAQCLLQPSDLLDLFHAYDGKGSSANRRQAITEMRNKSVGSWILRNTSVKDTETCKGFCLTVKEITGIRHHLIVHKIGAGVYYAAVLERKQEIPEQFRYTKVYPSIVHLIMDRCYQS